MIAEQLTDYELALLKRDREFSDHQHERLLRYHVRGLAAAEDMQYAIRVNMSQAVKVWSLSCQVWFTAWLMLRNPVIGRKYIPLAPTRQ